MKKKKFKAGDTVVCVDDRNSFLTKDEQYKVKHMIGEYVRVINRTGQIYDYKFDRFELVPNFKQGDRVSIGGRDNEYYFVGYKRDGSICVEISTGTTLSYQARVVFPYKEDEIEITVKFNGNEVPLSDISEETLIKLRNSSK